MEIESYFKDVLEKQNNELRLLCDNYQKEREKTLSELCKEASKIVQQNEKERELMFEVGRKILLKNKMDFIEAIKKNDMENIGLE